MRPNAWQSDNNRYFYNYVNSQHPIIQFTMEKEVDNELAFLDVLVRNNNPLNLQTSVFRFLTV